MGDGREQPADRKYIPHSVAYVAAWEKLNPNKIIPNYLPNQLTIESAVKKAFENPDISTPLHEVNQFADGELGAVWIPYPDITHYANIFRMVDPIVSPIRGYQILVSEQFFQGQFARNKRAGELSVPYRLLVSHVLQEIEKQKHTLIV